MHQRAPPRFLPRPRCHLPRRPSVSCLAQTSPESRVGQELDDEFFVVWDGFTKYWGNNHVPWDYVGREGLRSFLMARLTEGYSFPLNPKWILCDDGFRDLFAALQASPHAQESLNVWLPPDSGLREQLSSLVENYPNGFQPVQVEGQVLECLDQDLAG